MQRDVRDVKANLLAKGFIADNRDHEYFVYYTIAGKKSSVRTKVSHGGKVKSIGDDLIGRMTKQCRLEKKQFLDLVDCPLDRVGYESLLASQGLV